MREPMRETIDSESSVTMATDGCRAALGFDGRGRPSLH
jgi:hypothetical protein